MAVRTSVNLRTHLERFIVRATPAEWPWLRQNLRAMCATDWGEKYLSQAVAKWRGQEPNKRGFSFGKQGGESVCDAECDAISTDHMELLARAVILVAGMNLADAERVAMLTRVIADLTSPTTRIPESSSRAVGVWLCQNSAVHRWACGCRNRFSWPTPCSRTTS